MYAFIVERKSSHYQISIVAPVFLLSWIACLSTLIPDDSGEKYSFIIALELAIVFLLGTLDQQIAPAGNFNSAFLITVLMVGNTVLVVAFLKTLLMTMLRRKQENEKNIPFWLRQYCCKGTVQPYVTQFKDLWNLFDSKVTWITFVLQSLVTLFTQGKSPTYIFCVG